MSCLVIKRMFSLQFLCLIVGIEWAFARDVAASDCVTREEFESRLLELTDSYKREIEETKEFHQREIHKLQEANEALVKRVESLETLNRQNNEANVGNEEGATFIDHDELVIKDESGNSKDEHGGSPVSDNFVNDATVPNKTMETNNRIAISDKTSKGAIMVGGIRKLRRGPENTINVRARFLVNEAAETQVAFSVALLTYELTSLGTKQIIKFDYIVTNIDNVYDMRIGVFTAPISGYYVFSLTMMAMPNETQLIDVVKDGVGVFHVYAEGTFLNTVTNTMVVQVNKGQEVWVQTSGVPSYSRNLYGNGNTAFTGFLLYANGS